MAGWLVGFCVGFPYKSTYMHMVYQRAEVHKYRVHRVEQWEKSLNGIFR